MSVVRNLMVRAGADFTALTNGLNNAQAAVQTFGSRVGNVLSKLNGVLMAVGADFSLGTTIKEAAKVEGALMSLNRLLGDNAQEFVDWANTSAKAFGMSKAEAIDYGKTYSGLISTFSSDTKETMTMTKDLLKSSAVIASMTGREMTDVMERIRSGMLGNTEAIEDLGINVNVAMIESTETFRKFAGDKSWAQLDFKTQQQIRYFAILEQASKKFGTEVGDNTGLKMAQFSASLGDIRLALGEAFLPILNVILPSITKFIEAIGKGMSVVSQFVRALFTDTTKTSKKVGPELTKISSTVMETGQKVREMFISIAEKIKESKDIIISVLTGLTAGFILYTVWVTTAAKATIFFAAVATKLKAIWAFLTGPIFLIAIAVAALVAAFIYFYQTNEKFKGVVDNILRKIGEAAMWLWENALVPLGDILLNLWNTVFIPFGDWLMVNLPLAWDKVSQAAMWLWETVLVPLGEFLLWFWNGVIVPLGAYLGETLPQMWNKLSEVVVFFWEEVLKPVIDVLMQLYSDVLEPLAILLADVFAVAFEHVSTVMQAFWKDTLQPIIKSLGEALMPTIEAVTAVLMFLWKYVFMPLFKFIAGVVLLNMKLMINAFEFLWKFALKPLVNFLSFILMPVFKNVFKSLGGFISGLIDQFKGIMKFITGVFTGDWKKAWEGIKDIFGGIFKQLWSLAKFPLNMIIDGINILIGGLNKFKFKIPDWVPVIGGKGFSVNISKIPKLARGGIVDNPTMAMVGEAGSEMVVPLENTSFVDKVASALGTAVMSAMQMNGTQSPANRDIVLQIDGNTIAKVLQPYTTRESTRVGTSLITVL